MNTDDVNKEEARKEALAQFLRFADEDPREMEEPDLDAFLAEAGIDFVAFDKRLSHDIQIAHKKAKLHSAKENRRSFVQRAAEVIDLATMSREAKRVEIRQRLGVIGGMAAATVFNRNYEAAETEEDIDALLADLRALDERADDGSG